MARRRSASTAPAPQPAPTPAPAPAPTSSTSQTYLGTAGQDVFNDRDTAGSGGVTGNDVLRSGGGDDFLTSFNGVDVLDGGAGIDHASIHLTHITSNFVSDIRAIGLQGRRQLRQCFSQDDQWSLQGRGDPPKGAMAQLRGG